jgi:DNA-binding transcriptional regulator GbsR (MarR family)
VSNSLRELQTWNHPAGSGTGGPADFAAETDLWTLVSRIAAGRKVRELDPATDVLRQCVEMCRDDKAVDPVVQSIREMLDFAERISRWYDQMIACPINDRGAD